MININPILFFCKASNFKDDKKNHKRMKIIIKIYSLKKCIQKSTNLTDYSILTLFYLSFKTITEEIKKEEEEEK